MPYLVVALVVIVAGASYFLFMSPIDMPTETEPVAEAELPTPTPASNESAATEAEPMMRDDVVEDPQTSDDPAVSGLNPELSPEQEEVMDGFANGTYTETVSYFTPRRTEHVMDISLTLTDGVVTATEIVWDGDVVPKTGSHRGFDGAYEAEVLGQPIDEIRLSRTGGASLTSDAFNEAVDEIKQQARL